MAGPTLITSYFVNSGGSNSNTLTTPSFTPANGEIIAVTLTTWFTGVTMPAPTGGGQVYNQPQVSDPGGFRGYANTYYCKVSGSPGSFSISCGPPSVNCFHSMSVSRWANAQVAASPAVVSPTNAGTSAFSTSITTTVDNSVVVYCMSEVNSVDPAGHTYTPGSTVELGLYDGHVGANSVQYHAYFPTTTHGAQAFGLTSPTGLNWTVAGFEIQPATAAEVDLAVNFTGTGSMTAPLVDQVPLAASLVGTGSMTAPLVREVPLTAALTATGSMTPTLGPNETHLPAALTATGSMTAPLSVPSVGPQDPIAAPVANKLLVCLTTQLQELPSPPGLIQLRVGADTGPLVGPNVDECCQGLAWVRVASVYPSWDSFPAPDNTWLPCGPLAYAVVLEMGVAFCMPWSDSDDEFDNVDPPNTTDWSNAFATLMQHQTLMRRAAACCWPATQRRAVGEWNPLPVEGGCNGGTLRVTVSVPAPCADC